MSTEPKFENGLRVVVTGRPDVRRIVGFVGLVGVLTQLDTGRGRVIINLVENLLGCHYTSFGTFSPFKRDLTLKSLLVETHGD